MDSDVSDVAAVQDLTFLARSIRRAAVYYERASLEATDKTRQATHAF